MTFEFITRARQMGSSEEILKKMEEELGFSYFEVFKKILIDFKPTSSFFHKDYFTVNKDGVFIFFYFKKRWLIGKPSIYKIDMNNIHNPKNFTKHLGLPLSKKEAQILFEIAKKKNLELEKETKSASLKKEKEQLEKDIKYLLSRVGK